MSISIPMNHAIDHRPLARRGREARDEPGRTERRPARGLEDTLAQAVERHGRALVTLCSFQKEASVIVDALVRIDPGARVVTIDTGVLFSETRAAWRAFEERFGIQVEVQDARGAWTGPESCCGEVKVAALERALEGAEGWVTGIRRDQSPTRADAELVEFDDRRGIWKYSPLAHWTEREVWRRIHERGLPYHVLHDRGYASIGCAPCTLPSEGRAGRWAGSAKTECGLHV
jgi:phosphoadenosine phosphosulfate reductase